MNPASAVVPIRPRPFPQKALGASQAESGITAMELLLVIAILGIVLAIATPYLGDLIQRNRLVADASIFVVDLAFARSEAIKRRQPVTLCSSNDGITCTGSSDWSGGWLIFSDVAGDAVPNVSAGDCPQELTLTQDCLLRVRPRIGTGDELRNDSTMSHLVFRPDGSPANVANESVFQLCAPNRAFHRDSEFEITISATGLTTKTVQSCP